MLAIAFRRCENSEGDFWADKEQLKPEQRLNYAASFAVPHEGFN